MILLIQWTAFTIQLKACTIQCTIQLAAWSIQLTACTIQLTYGKFN